MPARLSKSKLLAFRQCERRLWLEIHRPTLRQDDSASVASFSTGHEVGELARRLYDPLGKGVLIDLETESFDAAFTRSHALLTTPQPIFEAGFASTGALSFADILLPVPKRGERRWRMVEVKSSTSVKDYHRDDVAIQSHVVRAAGVALDGVAIAHLDRTWVYPGGGDYQGLLVEEDLTQEAFERDAEVQGWVTGAHAITALKHEPEVSPGAQCDVPYRCGFAAHCRGNGTTIRYPVSWLPQIRSTALKQCIADGAADMRQVPDALLNDKQRRVKHHTLSGEPYFDAEGAARDLEPHRAPAYFIDFETISFAIPLWKGTSPYQAIPFQFSAHRLGRTGTLGHRAFLDLSGRDPSRAFAEALIAACGERGPVFVYNASFEVGRITELAARFPRLRTALLALVARIVDLLPVARERFYHPSQQGSWSIKHLLPAVAPELCYDNLDGVQDGGSAMQAYLEAIDANTTFARKQEIERQLLAYCHLDTLAMVKLWEFFAMRH